MSWKEKIENRRQQEQARQFFRENNPEFFTTETWLKLVFVGLALAIACGFAYMLFTMVTHVNFSYILALMGIVIARALKKIAHTGNFKIGILTIVFYILALVLSHVFAIIWQMGALNHFFEFLFTPDVWRLAINMMASRGLMTGMIYFIGGAYAYQSALYD